MLLFISIQIIREIKQKKLNGANGGNNLLYNK